MYRCGAEDSIKQKTVYKLYEYLDDHHIVILKTSVYGYVLII